MTQFLKQVAAHYHAQENMEQMCFVFPNRRALVFFQKYLASEVAAAGKPTIAPRLLTQNDFLYTVAGARSTDKVHLLLRLYDCYKKLVGESKVEALDDFLFWGDVLLGDFGDVDKYLVDPAQLFTDVAQFKGMNDYSSYLSDVQKAALEHFLSHFEAKNTESGVKGEFLKIWNILLPLYRDFNAALREEGSWYEGMVHRDLAQQFSEKPAVDILADRFPQTRKYVFVGLNALNECEKKVLSKMHDAHLAEFCWDYSSDWIKHPANRSSRFLSENLERFPQAFKLDPEGLGVPEFHTLSVPSSIGQAAQLPEIFRRLSTDLSRLSIDTAVVLPDESLLLPVLNSIPPEIQDINVTMGYPMSASALYTLMDSVNLLQRNMRQKDGQWFFYHKIVWSVFSNSLIKSAVGEDGLQLIADIKKDARYYVPQSAFSGNALLETIFTPVVKDQTSRDPQLIKEIAAYQLRVILAVAAAARNVPDMALELDFASEYYRTVQKLSRENLAVLPATYFSILNRLTDIGSDSIPFKGEPLKGLQIMGPLEMRALDFENLIILSCNEGLFPRRSVSSSFIPPELRRGFALPTYEYQDALWAYYFYRMVQRAKHVWLVSDSRPDVSRGGEESRYIKQLEYHFGVDVHRCSFVAPIKSAPALTPIQKTPEMLEAMKAHELSASTLQYYLDCPAHFYYAFVEKLHAEEEITESLDSGMIGNVFHKTMETLYKNRVEIKKSYIKGLLSDKTVIRSTVRQLIMTELKTFEVVGRNLIFEDVVCEYVFKALERDLELLESKGLESFRIYGLERLERMKVGNFQIKGFIDRLDSFEPGSIRVVDYKTGKVEEADINITASNAASVAESLFRPENSKRPKIALQLYIYDQLVQKKYPDLRIINSIYQTSKLFSAPVPEVDRCQEFCDIVREKLDNVLSEIENPLIPFEPRPSEHNCRYCDFKMFCGK